MDVYEATTPLHVGNCVLIAVQRRRVESAHAWKLAWARVSVEPTALVLRSPAGWRALTMDGTELALEELLVELPDLRASMRQAEAAAQRQPPSGPQPSSGEPAAFV